jgi:hypothetical protein
MHRRRNQSDPRRHGRAAIVWGLVVYFAAIIAQAAGFDSRPELYDIEYATRLALLRTRIAEAPDRPLLLVIGSSRTCMGFAPEQLPPLTDASGAKVLPFNFGHVGAGPLMNLMDVSRMLADGIRPRWVFVEMMPTFVSHEGMAFISLHTAARDLRVLRDYMQWHRLYGDYALRRLWQAPRYSGELMRAVAPDLAPDPPTTSSKLLPLGGCTYLKDDVTPADRERSTELARKNLQGFLQKFQVSPWADGATRTLLTRLRAEGIQTGLLLMPEGTILKSWYPPGAETQLNHYCAAVSRAYGAPVVDARTWLADDEMADQHHALKRGAAAFTARLGREVFRPYVTTGDTSWAARLDGAVEPVAYNGLTPTQLFSAPLEASCSSGSPPSPSPPILPPTGSDKRPTTSATSAR